MFFAARGHAFQGFFDAFFPELFFAAHKIDNALLVGVFPIKPVVVCDLGVQKDLPDFFGVAGKNSVLDVRQRIFEGSVLADEFKRCFGSDAFDAVRVKIGSDQDADVN